MKRKVTTPDASSIEKTAGGDSAASEKTTPSPAKAKPRKPPADKLVQLGSLQSVPSAMDLLNIVCMFELIPPPTPWDISNCENMLAKMNGLAELEKDEEFCRHLEEAGRLYRLAEAVAHKTRQASPKPDTKVIRRNLLRNDQLRRIWEYASQLSVRNKYLPIDAAMRALHFKTEDSFRQFIRTFFYPFYKSSGICVDVIRILKILQTEQSRKRDAESKQRRRDTIRKNNGQSVPSRQVPTPDIVYRDLLNSLSAAFQQAGVEVDASLFFEISLPDILDRS
ncbi:MAG: hypothetical protein WCQ16_01080 [Verrucomicrobiae bacterium]